MQVGTVKQRFQEKVWVDLESGCWIWTGAHSGDGYGRFSIGSGPSRTKMAHRVSYEIHVGPIPDGLQIDHLCRVKGCVSPDHLEPVTQRENLLRGDTLAARNAAKTHCLHGHEYTAENTYWYPNRRKRYCRTCEASWG